MCMSIIARILLVKVRTLLRDSNEWIFVSCIEFHLVLRYFLHRRTCCKSRSPCSYQLVIWSCINRSIPFLLFPVCSPFFLFLDASAQIKPCPSLLYRFPEFLFRLAVSGLEREISRIVFIIKEMVRRCGTQFQIEINGYSS
jgi:hypothetical protein